MNSSTSGGSRISLKGADATDFHRLANKHLFNNAFISILQSLHAHSQFCISGDHTVEAA